MKLHGCHAAALAVSRVRLLDHRRAARLANRYPSRRRGRPASYGGAPEPGDLLLELIGVARFRLGERDDLQSLLESTLRQYWIKLNFPAQVGGHLFESFDEVVADARAGTTGARLDAHACRAPADSFTPLFLEYRHGSALNKQNSWIVALPQLGCVILHLH
jgi:hypothetical protein